MSLQGHMITPYLTTDEQVLAFHSSRTLTLPPTAREDSALVATVAILVRGNPVLVMLHTVQVFADHLFIFFGKVPLHTFPPF